MPTTVVAAASGLVGLIVGMTIGSKRGGGGGRGPKRSDGSHVTRLGDLSGGTPVKSTPHGSATPTQAAAAAHFLQTKKPGAAPDGGGGGSAWDVDNFRKWCRMKMGDGGTVHWYISGDLYEYPTGRLLAKVEGVDLARGMTERPDEVVHQLSRKFFIFRDPKSGKVLTEFDGSPVVPIRYPYQHIVYRHAPGEGGVSAEVTMGSGEFVTRMMGNSISVRRLDGTDRSCFTCPVFLNLDTDQGPYEAYENYDYFHDGVGEDPNASSTGAAGEGMGSSGAAGGLSVGSSGGAHHCTWVRFGAAAPFSESAVLHALMWRVGRFADLPAELRAYIDDEAPMWRDAPKDLEEIKRLQAAPDEEQEN